MADRSPKEIRDKIAVLNKRAEAEGALAVETEAGGDGRTSDAHEAAAMEFAEQITALQQEYTDLTGIVVRMDGSVDIDTEVGPHTFALPAKEMLKASGIDPTDMTVADQTAKAKEIEAARTAATKEALDDDIAVYIGEVLDVDTSDLTEDELVELVEANAQKLQEDPYRHMDVITEDVAIVVERDDGTTVVVDESAEIVERFKRELPTNIPESLADKVRPGSGTGERAGTGGDGRGTAVAPPSQGAETAPPGAGMTEPPDRAPSEGRGGGTGTGHPAEVPDSAGAGSGGGGGMTTDGAGARTGTGTGVGTGTVPATPKMEASPVATPPPTGTGTADAPPSDVAAPNQPDANDAATGSGGPAAGETPEHASGAPTVEGSAPDAADGVPAVLVGTGEVGGEDVEIYAQADGTLTLGDGTIINDEAGLIGEAFQESNDGLTLDEYLDGVFGEDRDSGDDQQSGGQGSSSGGDSGSSQSSDGSSDNSDDEDDDDDDDDSDDDGDGGETEEATAEGDEGDDDGGEEGEGGEEGTPTPDSVGVNESARQEFLDSPLGDDSRALDDMAIEMGKGGGLIDVDDPGDRAEWYASDLSTGERRLAEEAVEMGRSGGHTDPPEHGGFNTGAASRVDEVRVAGGGAIDPVDDVPGAAPVDNPVVGAQPVAPRGGSGDGLGFEAGSTRREFSDDLPGSPDDDPDPDLGGDDLLDDGGVAGAASEENLSFEMYVGIDTFGVDTDRLDALADSIDDGALGDLDD